MKPFLDQSPIHKTGAMPRQVLSRRYGLDPARCWLVSTAMFRAGDKTRSFAVLAKALKLLSTADWQLLIIGDGENRNEVKGLFSPLSKNRIFFAGLLQDKQLYTVLKACDLFVWPAINEAFGMALLQAQCCGLPVVSGSNLGVANIVRDQYTGLLSEPGNHKAMAQQMTDLIINRERRQQFSALARDYVKQHHSITQAASTLSRSLSNLRNPGQLQTSGSS
jgi:glycosyltransferase involved in cell wall biosynthesis